MTALGRAGFGGTVVFGALAALAFTPIVKLAREWIDSTPASALFLTLAAALYVGMLAKTRSHAIAVVLLVLAVGLSTAVFASSLAPTALGLSLALACSRARVLYRGRLNHPWLVELGLLIAALIAIQVVVSHDYFGIALAIWVYWLVQSAFFLVRTQSDGDRVRTKADPFDAAAERATELMDTTP